MDPLDRSILAASARRGADRESAPAAAAHEATLPAVASGPILSGLA